MQKRFWFCFLLAFHLIKQLVWLGIIPLWHFPDEEQHFSQTAFLAETGRLPQKDELDVNQEINLSSEILGTRRDSRGINNFTYHPEYRIPYTKDFNGLWEKDIKALNKNSLRQSMVKREAARYGPVYYFLTSLAYKAFYQCPLWDRVFAGRFVSVLLSSLNILLIYLIGRQLFKEEFLAFSLAFLSSFLPMFSFVSSGVNSDNLFNLIFTAILYFCLKIFFTTKSAKITKNKKPIIIHFIGLALALAVGFKTKPQIIVSLPIIFTGLALSLFLVKKVKTRRKYWSLLGLGLIAGIIWLTKFAHIPEYDPSAPSKLTESFLQYILWHLRHTITETIPWYWGVFNWLGVTLPSWVNKIQARLLIVAALGIVVYFCLQLKDKKIFSLRNLKTIFLLLSAGLYYFSIISWDFFFRQTKGYSFGLQGRYFFPTIVAHMFIILLGLKTLIPQKLQLLFLKIFLSWWLVFQLIGLYTATKAYYDLWPPLNFVYQASQYKPVMVKQWGISVVLLLFFIFCLIYLFKLWRLKKIN